MMFLSVQIIFWLCVTALIYSYALYPVILKWLTRNKRPNQMTYRPSDDLPAVAILLAAYNEEKVIREKVVNAFDTTYPAGKLEVWVGSDSSNDRTNEILKKLTATYPKLIFIPYEKRTGKSQILNDMQSRCMADILVFTDATTMFTPDTLLQLVQHFKNPEIGLVSGNFISTRKVNDSINQQETAYLKRENEIKYHEGLLGCVIGSFGPVFALRRELYTHIPPGFIMDDFFLTLGVLDKGFKAIMEKNAVALEEMDTNLQQEYRRKRRFSIGNFRNHSYFRSFHNPFSSLRNWCYFSHKYLRWMGPFIILAGMASLAVLSFKFKFYAFITLASFLLILGAFLDFLFLKTEMQLKPFRFLFYFLVANAALLDGFFQYLLQKRAVSSWNPVNR